MAAQKLSFGEKVNLVVGGVGIAFSVLVGAVTNAFPGRSKASTYKLRFNLYFMRTFSRFLTALQIQSITPGTEDNYKSTVQERSLQPNSVRFDDGTQGHWIGNSKAPVVLLFLHGGGYATYAQKGHFVLASDLVSAAESKGGSLGILLVEYDLAPNATYPHQLRQAIHAYKYCVERLNISTSNILLAGDSAGGHLALGLLSHMTHPQDGLPKITAGVGHPSTMLISPWVTFDLSSNSMKANRLKDCLSQPTLHTWSRNFLGQAPLDNYNFPLGAQRSWWSPMQDIDLFVIAGADEIFVDDIEQWVDNLKEAGLKPKYHRVEGEAHDEMIWSEGFGFGRPTSKSMFEDWVCSQVAKREK
ncbi:Alpha/Beta hydrolase protein [Ilyonectria sp. MPI-CAGE-AT-0026]|nr:Alpha/Beta hydrolase protein [Ilyonectria sp. MPI-CAGE-AT-0026]